MYLFLIGFLFAFISVKSASIESYKSYEDYKVFSISGNRDALIELTSYFNEYDSSLGPNETGSLIVDDYKKALEVIVAPAVLPVFHDAVKARQLNSTLVYDDFSKIIRLEKEQIRRSDSFFTAYHDIDVINDFLLNTSKQYSNITEIVYGGRSYEGRYLVGLKILTPVGSESKPVVFIESGIHAREWIAPAVTTYFINELLTSNDSSVVKLRDNFEWHIFPSVNPDGYHYTHLYDRLWRKTRSKTPDYPCFGADANRNWDYKWSTVGTSSNPCNYQTSPGTKAFSEVETRSLSRYIEELPKLQAYIGFHSYGQYLLLPLSDSSEHVDNYDDLVQIGKTSLKYGARKSKLEPYHPPGTAAEILYPVSGGSMDWVRAEQGTPLVFTYELRGQGFSWPPDKIPQQGDEVTQMMVGLFHEAEQLGYF